MRCAALHVLGEDGSIGHGARRQAGGEPRVVELHSQHERRRRELLRGGGAARRLDLASGDRLDHGDVSDACQSNASQCTLKAQTGRSMFFSDKPPKSSNVAFTRPATASRMLREIRMPPVGASTSNRAATLTPSP